LDKLKLGTDSTDFGSIKSRSSAERPRDVDLLLKRYLVRHPITYDGMFRTNKESLIREGNPE